MFSVDDDVWFYLKVHQTKYNPPNRHSYYNKLLSSHTSFVTSDKKKRGGEVVQRRKAVSTITSQFLLSSFSTSQKNQFTWNISKLCQKLPLNAYFSNKFRLVCKSLTSKHSNFVTRFFRKD